MSFVERLREWTSSPKVAPFVPKSIVCLLEGYSRKDFFFDLSAGVTVGVISLPLAMALSIAAGLDPEKGLYTAIVAGLLNALFSGSRFLIGGPTGAYVILIYGVVQKYGFDGLACATLEAAVILFLLGCFKCGSLVRFIPYPVIVGFTSGISLALLSTQIKDFFGLSIPTASVDVIDKVSNAIQYSSTANIYAIFLSVLTLVLIYVFRSYSKKFPGVIVALCIAATLNIVFHLDVETIESRFGIIPGSLPVPHFPEISFELLRKTFPDAVGIALLGAIESLLCAVIADSLTGTRHKSNCELIAQGIANFGSVIFGGIPSTGAIARTTTSLQLHAKTPMAAIVHSLTILVLMVLFAPYASMIPLSAIAAVLVYVAANMFEYAQMRDLVRGWRGEALVMLATLLITVFVDLNVAVQTGVLLAIILFLKRSAESSKGKLWQEIEKDEEESDTAKDQGGSWQMTLPQNVQVYELEGPFFFAVADMLADIFTRFEKTPSSLIIRMRSVPFIDSTAVQALKRFVKQCQSNNVELFLAELTPAVKTILNKADFFTAFPTSNVLEKVDDISRVTQIQAP